MTIAKRVAKNTFFMLSGSVFGHMLSLVAVTIAARKLGMAEFGLFSFARSFPLFFIFIATMGTESIITREVAVHRSDDGEYLRKYVGKLIPLRLLLMVAAIACTIITLKFSGKDAHTVAAVSLITFYMMGRTALTFFLGIFRGLEEMKYITIASILEPLLTVCLFILMMREGDTALRAGYFIIISMCSTLAVCFVVHWRLVGFSMLGIDIELWKKTISESWPLALGAISSQIFSNTDIAMISFMKGDELAGLYAACVNVANIAGYLSMAFAAAVFPVISNFFVKEPGALVKSNEKAIKVISLYGLPICMGGAILSHPILTTLFGKEFGEAAEPLAILFGASVFWIYMAFYLLFAIGIHKQKPLGIAFAICAVGNIIFNAVLIPLWGINGAAISTLISRAILVLVVFFFIIRPYHRFDGMGFFIKIALSLGAMACVLTVVKSMDIWLSIPIGGVTYILAVLLLRPFSKEDVELVKKVFSRHE